MEHTTIKSDNKQKQILVTGGAGYLGSWLCRLLLNDGYSVVCLDNLSYGDKSILELYSNPDFRFIKGDICNIRDMTQALHGCDAVIALAAIVGDPACNLNETDTYSVNYESTKILASLCEFYRISRIVFASSCSVYGANDILTLNEGSLLNPISLYSRTRVMSEQVLLQSKVIRSVILRLATLYGYSHRPRFDLVLNFFTAQGLRERQITVHGGSQFRPIVNVQDAAKAFILALEAPSEQVCGEIFNVGSNTQNYTINDIANLSKSAIPQINVNYSTDLIDKRNYRVSFDKIYGLLSFLPNQTPVESMKELASEIEKQRLDYKNDIYYNVRYLYKK